MTKKKRISSISFPKTKKFNFTPKDVTWSSNSGTQIESPEDEIINEKEQVPQTYIPTTLLKTATPDKVTVAEPEHLETAGTQEKIGRSLWDIVWYFTKGNPRLLGIMLPFFYIFAVGVSGKLTSDTILLHLIMVSILIVLGLVVGTLTKGTS